MFFEASKSVSTKTRLLKHYFRRPGNGRKKASGLSTGLSFVKAARLESGVGRNDPFDWEIQSSCRYKLEGIFSMFSGLGPYDLPGETRKIIRTGGFHP